MSALDQQWLINQFNIPGPRYTSYPTALNFSSAIGETDFSKASQLYPARPLSLYVHLPFCHTLCFYCGCNKAVTRDKARIGRYLKHLHEEIRQRASLFSQREVTQLHWGGGTPSYLTDLEMSALFEQLRAHYHFSDSNVENSIEIDPREFPVNRLDHLAHLGFNRLSFGVQDFTLTVQKAINRIQPIELIEALLNHARQLNFASINFDLIYGLPFQQLESFSDTIDKVCRLRPDRISLFGYAYLPERFLSQRLMDNQHLPDATLRIELLQMASEKLKQSGYVDIGMDHFALPDNELALAQHQNALHRNFQGYTTQNNTDLLGFGVSAISQIGHLICQNDKSLREYQSRLLDYKSPIWGGLVLSQDDQLRARVINQLICNFSLDIQSFEATYANALSNQPFNVYFKSAREDLSPLIEANIIEWNTHRIQIHEIGRILVRRVCMAFDQYCQLHKTRYSRIL